MISTIHTNAGITLAQAQPHATGARVSDGNGNHIDVTYDEASGAWLIEPSFRSDVLHNIRTPGATYELRKI